MTDTFVNSLVTHINSGFPIVAVKTRDPIKALEDIGMACSLVNTRINSNTAYKKDSDLFRLYEWDVVRGFRYAVLKAEQPYSEKAFKTVTTESPVSTFLDVLEFARVQEGEDGLEELLPDDNSEGVSKVFSCLWPQNYLQNPQVVTNLLLIADQFSYNSKMLVLVVPEETELPKELHDYISFVDYSPPEQDKLYDLIEPTLNPFNITPPTKEDAKFLLSAGAGMIEVEFVNNLSKCCELLQPRRKELSKKELLQNLSFLMLTQKTEMIKRNNILELMPTSNMNQIGGLDILKSWIKKRKVCFSPEALEFGVDTPKGIGLFGPPGTGKSASAKAIGAELELPVIKFDVSKVFASYVGESETRVRSCLELIKAISPCVVMVDEIDKVFDSGGGGDSGVGNRILGSILTFMQESNAPVFWVMTGNRVQHIPSELLRKGRLDEVFCLTVPNKVEREEILKIHLRKRKQDPDNIKYLASAVKDSEGYTAAELEAAVKEALVEAYSNDEDLTGELIVSQIRNMTPLKESFKEDFEAMQDWAEKNARPASSPVDESLVKETKELKSAKSKAGAVRLLEREE